VGALILLALGAAAVDAMVARARALEHLAGMRSGDRTEREAARREAAASGILGRIEAPDIGLDAAVLEGTGTVPLMRGVGHEPASARPGEAGNVILAGHRDTHFRALRGMRVGDRVQVTTAAGRFGYRVDSILVVEPDRTDLLSRVDHERLTLVTCYPFHWIGPAPRRLLVFAHPADLSGSGE
jgi:sortase A